MKIENFIAFRYIIQNRKNKEISSSSVVVCAAIASAIIFFIAAVSIMNGYIQGRMQIQFEVTSFHLAYFDINEKRDADFIVEKLIGDKDVKSVFIYRETKALLSANGINSGLAYFRAIPRDIFSYDEGFANYLRIENGNTEICDNEIVLSKKTANKLKVSTGEYIYLTAMALEDKSKIKFKRLKVVDLFSTGFIELDEQMSYINLETCEDIFGKDVTYSVAVKLNDYKDTLGFARNHKFNSFSYQSTWIEENFNEFTALKFEKNVIAFIVLLVVIVAALNVLTAIHITVLEKIKDVGILKATGYSPRNIILIFLLNGYYIGFVGVFIGAFIGLFVMSNLNEIIVSFGYLIDFYQNFIYIILRNFIDIARPENVEIFSKDFYLDKIYTDISFWEIALVGFVALHFSLIAAIIPSVKAGKVKPYEVIRNG